MEWSNEVVMEFLDLYEGEPAIWNPQHQHHKDRNQIHDAWERIQNNISLECSFKQLKRRKEILMSTYRKLAIKVQNSKRTNELFKPGWFAYDRMASFLHDVYTPRTTKSSERQENELDNDEDLLDNGDKTNFNVVEPSESSSVNEEDIAVQGTTAINEFGPPTAKIRKLEKTGLVEKRLDEAYLFLKQVATNPKVVKDETYLFCELLGCKLRALDEETREVVMHEINNLIFNIKKSRRQHLSDPLLQPGYVQSYAVNPLQSPDYGSSESSMSQISGPSNAIIKPESGLHLDNENGEGCHGAADLLTNYSVVLQ